MAPRFFSNFGGVNLKLRISVLMLGMMTLMPSICFAQDADSTVLSRIWSYRRNYTRSVNGQDKNVYVRFSFGAERRNFTLFLVPTMYVIAKGERQYIGESYCKMRFRDIDDYDLQRQIVCGTIPRQHMAMPALLESVTPDLYGISLYPNRLLSPFHRDNRHFYRYQVNTSDGISSIVKFRPHTKNTQLVSGQAIVDTYTGKIQSVQFEGEFDMISFKVSVDMNQEDMHTPLPKHCSTDATFRFLGNRITSNITAVFDCPTTLPDSLDEKEDRKWMEQLRPIPLTPKDQAIYQKHDEKVYHIKKEEQSDTTFIKEKYDWFKEIGWNIIGDILLNGHSTSSGPISVGVSPLLNPLYLSYSKSRGLSYKLKFGIRYRWNAYRYLTLNPQLGYNFKLNQIFYSAPLRMTYNPKRNGYAEITLANGNHISNGELEEAFQRQMGDSVSMPWYKDQYLQVVNNVVAFDWLEIKTGFVYHRRSSTNRTLMKQAGLEDEYRSFAPMLMLRFTPWYNGPTLTANYEYGLKNVLRSNLGYERYEFDAAYLHKMKSLRIINVRGGVGFYTHRNPEYFADYDNFKDNNLPTGWEDDWSGQFQLLDSRWYNESNYYVRGHLSYDSPMLLLNRLPLFGRIIEKERIYLSALSIQHTRPYLELGYGFTNRYFSTGLFGSFLGGKAQEFGCKFTIELFRRW